MGDSLDQSSGWQDDDDDTDWVRLYFLSPNLWSDYLDEVEGHLEAGDATPADLARFIERCLRSARCLSDLDAKLPGLGLTFWRFGELRDQAMAAERAAAERDVAEISENDTTFSQKYRARRRPVDAGPLSAELAAFIMNLSLRGLDDERIVCTLDIHHTWPDIVRRRTRLHPRAAHVVAGHLAGQTLGEIAKATNVPASTALRILRQIGETPNGAKQRVDAAARARTIIKLRARGDSYKEIAERVGCSMDVVKNVLRRKRRHRYGGGHVSE